MSWIDECNEEIKKFGGQAGIVVFGPESHKKFLFNSSQKFPSASTIKLPILMYCMEKGICDNKEKIRVGDLKKVAGTGVLKELSDDVVITFKDAAMLMTIVSDNVATNLLIDRIGMDELKDYLAGLYLENTELNRHMMDLDAIKNGRENYTSARDMYLCLKYCHENRENYPEIIEILKKQQYNEKVPFYVPDNVVIAHKTGEVGKVSHDVGIMYLSEPVIFAILTMAETHMEERNGILKNLGRIIYNEFR